MSCNLTTTTTNCIPCIHPLEYLFEFVGLGLANQGNKDSFAETLLTILNGTSIVQPNCKPLCCPDCNGLYALASVETMLKLFEGIGLAGVGSDFQGCCSNVFGSYETYGKYAEGVNIIPAAAVPASPGPLSAAVLSDPYVETCCNGFNDCLEELICWNTQGIKNHSEVLDRIQDKGIVEFGNIVNNCTGTSVSSICKLTELLNEYISADKNANKNSKSEAVDYILDVGIVVYCNPDGNIVVGGVEDFLKYYEAIGDGGGPVPAISNS